MCPNGRNIVFFNVISGVQNYIAFNNVMIILIKYTMYNLDLIQ